jgi:hypothetical protein
VLGDYLGDAVDRIFSYTATADTDRASHVEGILPEADPDGSWEQATGVSLPAAENERFDVEHEATWNDRTGKTRQLHDYTITVENELEHSARFRKETECPDTGRGGSGGGGSDSDRTCYEYERFTDESTVTFEKEVTVGGTYSDDA